MLPEYCDQCIDCVTTERDHRNYQACTRISPLYNGVLGKGTMAHPPAWCPRRHGIAKVRFDYMHDTITYTHEDGTVSEIQNRGA